MSLYAFAFSAYFTTSLFGMVVAGQWADRRGPLGALGVGISGFAAGLLLSGTALNMWTFIAGRAVQGLGGGLVIVALYVVMGRAYPARLQPTIMAAFAAGWVVPSVVGPLVAGTVTEQLGWRWVFIGIPVLVVFPLALALPATRRMASGPADPSAPVEPFDRRRIKLALGISVGAGASAVRGAGPAGGCPCCRSWQAWLCSAPPSRDGAPCCRTAPGGRRGGCPSVVLLRGVAAGSFIAAESFVPLMLVTQRGLTPTMAGLSLAVGGADLGAGFLRTGAAPDGGVPGAADGGRDGAGGPRDRGRAERARRGGAGVGGGRRLGRGRASAWAWSSPRRACCS